MNLTEYQQAVTRTMGNLPTEQALANWGLGLAGETGEVIEHIKKHVFHGKPLYLPDVMKELGDVAWYLAAICNQLNIRLEDVLKANVEKLEKRYPDGFKSHQSKP